MRIFKESCDNSKEKEVSIDELFYELDLSIKNNKRYGQLEKLEAKINILYELLSSYIKKESLEKTLVNLVSMESNYNSYYIKEENEEN